MKQIFKLLIGVILQAMLAVFRGISLKVKLSNNLLVAVLQAMLAVCRGIKMIKIPYKLVNGIMLIPATANDKESFLSLMVRAISDKCL